MLVHLWLVAVFFNFASSASYASQQSIPAEASAHFREAQLAESRGDWALAETNYRKAIEIAPHWAEALINLGVVCNRLGKTDEAIKAFTRASEIKPDLVAALLNLGITYFRLGRYNEAVAPLNQAIRIESENAQARQLLAISLIGIEDFHGAAEQLEYLRERNSQDSAVLLALGQSYLRVKDY